MTATLQATVMAFGAVVAGAGLILLFLRKEEAQNKIRLLGQEFEISTPALVVFLVGCAVFLIPLLVPLRNLDTPLVVFDRTNRAQVAGNTPGPRGEPAQSPVREEKEPNDQSTEANLIEIGTRARGRIATAEDRDFFTFKTSGGDARKTTVILRKLSPSGFSAAVAIYDKAERLVKRDTESGDTPVSVTFVSAPNALYSVSVRTAHGVGPYELEVREE